MKGSVVSNGLSAITRDSRFADLWDDPGLAERALQCNRQRVGPASLAATIQWLDGRKATNHMLVRRVGLKTLEEWCLDEHRFLSHRDRRFFSVIGLEVTSCNREVATWSQPIISNPESGIIGLLVREERWGRSFLLQAKAEAGNRSVVQLGPTVQFTPGNYSGNEKLAKPFLVEEFASPAEFPVLCENRQAEEGARFYREAHLHRVLLLPAGRELALPDDYRWVAEEEVRFFLHLGEYVNSCCRSILACLL
jgi:oxidase EvaA